LIVFESLGLVHEVRYLVDIEVQESPLLVDGVAAEVLAEKYVPIGLELLVHVFLQVLSHLEW
jgi:hypothetical protein